MKKLGLKLSDIRSMMEATYRRISEVTGHADVDTTKEQQHSRIIPTPKDKTKNELVLVSWSAVSARSSDDMTPNDFDAGVLLSGQGEPEVIGALVLGVCDRLLRMGVDAGAFPDIRVPLAMLASSLIPDMSDDDDDDRCGHA